MKPDKIDLEAEDIRSPSLDEIPWYPTNYSPSVVPAPRKCRRHDWAPLSTAEYVGWQCNRCGKPRDEATAKRGRTNRNRGNAIEREVAARLGLRRVGQFGGPDDIAGDVFRAQVKSGGSFSERYWGWLRAVPATAEQTRLLIVTDAPGPGHRRRAIVVLDLDDWIALHGEKL